MYILIVMRLNPKLNQAVRKMLPPSSPGPVGDDTSATTLDCKANTREDTTAPIRRDMLKA
jgi:hypothetical protein